MNTSSGQAVGALRRHLRGHVVRRGTHDDLCLGADRGRRPGDGTDEVDRARRAMDVEVLEACECGRLDDARSSDRRGGIRDVGVHVPIKLPAGMQHLPELSALLGDR